MNDYLIGLLNGIAFGYLLGVIRMGWPKFTPKTMKRLFCFFKGHDWGEWKDRPPAERTYSFIWERTCQHCGLTQIGGYLGWVNK